MQDLKNNIKCYSCNNKVVPNHDFIETTDIDGANFDRYICEKCRKKNDNSLKPKINGAMQETMATRLRFVLCVLMAFIVCTPITAIIIVLTKYYHIILALAVGFTFSLIVNKTFKNVLSTTKRITIVLVAVISYMLAVGIADFVLGLDYLQVSRSSIISFILMNPSGFLSYLMIDVPKFIFTDIFQIISLLALIFSAWWNTRQMAIVKPKVRYRPYKA